METILQVCPKITTIIFISLQMGSVKWQNLNSLTSEPTTNSPHKSVMKTKNRLVSSVQLIRLLYICTLWWRIKLEPVPVYPPSSFLNPLLPLCRPPFPPHSFNSSTSGPQRHCFYSNPGIKTRLFPSFSSCARGNLGIRSIEASHYSGIPLTPSLSW